MIAPPANARILLATKPVDFRKGAHGLAALAAGLSGIYGMARPSSFWR